MDIKKVIMYYVLFPVRFQPVTFGSISSLSSSVIYTGIDALGMMEWVVLRKSWDNLNVLEGISMSWNVHWSC